VNFFYDDIVSAVEYSTPRWPWGREWAWPRGITVRRFSHAPICIYDVGLKMICNIEQHHR